MQRGVASAAGTITISSVVMNKAVVLSVSKGSGGYVAARGSLTLQSKTYGSQTALGDTPAGSVISASTGAISGGTTDLTVKEYSAVLTDSTTLTCDGPVEWQVIEYY